MINPQEPKLHLIEVELIRHGFDHIQPQLRRFSFNFKDNKEEILMNLKAEVQHAATRDTLEKLAGTIGEDISWILYKAVFTDRPYILLIIDEVDRDIEEWRKEAPEFHSVMQFRTYVRTSTTLEQDFIHSFTDVFEVSPTLPSIRVQIEPKRPATIHVPDSIVAAIEEIRKKRANKNAELWQKSYSSCTKVLTFPWRAEQ